MSESKFGTELGLMHQVAVNGREVGADREFWKILADDKKLLEEFVKMAKSSVELVKEDVEILKKWLVALNLDCPFQELESYYANSSHCRYVDFLRQYHIELKPLFSKAQHNEKVRVLCEEVECYFVLCYTLSALWSWTNLPKKEWFHHPSSGLFITFHEVVDDDERAPRGWYLTLQHFLENESVKLVEGIRVKHLTRYNAWCSKKADMPIEVVVEILETCRTAREMQKAKIVSMIN